jgi:hypothetical protein
MKRILLFTFMVAGFFLLLTNFATQALPVIKEPVCQKVVKGEEKAVVKERAKLKVKPLAVVPEKQLVKKVKEPPELVTYYPDPTRGYIENRTYNVFIKVWLAPSFEVGRKEALPDLDLPPQAIMEASMPLDEHSIYAQGRVKTYYGWISVGSVNKRITIDHRVYSGGHYGWKLIFRQSDFRR